MTTTQKLAVLDPNQSQYWMEAHAFGCADLKKNGKGLGSWSITVSSLVEAAEEIAWDFIGEDDQTAEDYANNHIHFAPCVHLPLHAPAEPPEVPVEAPEAPVVAPSTFVSVASRVAAKKAQS